MIKRMFLTIILIILLFSTKVYALDNKLNISSVNYSVDSMINLSDINEEHSVKIGKQLKLYATTYGNCGDGTNCLTTNKYLKVISSNLSDVVWESSNQQVATVNSDGLVTGIKEGITDIKATYDNQEATYTITVSTVLGDVDKNSIVDINDAKLIAEYIIDKSGIDEDGLLVANYDSNNNIKMNDVMKLISDVDDNWINTISDKECTGIGANNTCTIDSNTLKVWVEKKSLKNKSYKCLNNYPYNCTNDCICISGESIVADRNFYVTHIWVKDPYNQIKTKLVDKKEENIFKISEDGILRDNQFKYASVDSNNAFYNDNIRTYYDIVRNNPKYTFSFYSTLMRGGNSVLADSSLTSKNMRQVLCQVDKNNFIILTSEYAPGADGNRPFSVGDSGGLTPINEDDRNAYYYARIYGILSFDDTLKELQSLGCQTAVNLDGGGSIALLMRKNGQTNVISGDNRVTPDILYFHE